MFCFCLGRPHSPKNFSVYLVGYMTVNLTWISGFNGGYEQMFRIQYRKTQKGWKTASNISDPGSDLVVHYLLSSLDSNKEYEFGIKSFNRLGESEGSYTGITTLGEY